ncbi:MAG: hypothetical protein RR572_02510 [Raoultibacter sp.]
MYEVSLEQAWESFAAHLSGAREGLICVVSNHPLDAPARTALESSFAALGWGAQAGVFLTLHAQGVQEAASAEKVPADEGAAGESGAGGAAADETMLDEGVLFEAIEGIDPLLLVATDKQATEALGHAYHQEIPCDKHTRLFGRTTCAFTSFSTLLTEKETKQKAWKLLKTLGNPS